MKHFFSQQKKVLLVLLGVITVFLSASGSYGYFSRHKNIPLSNTSSEVLSAAPSLDTTLPPEDLKTVTVLLLGYGGAGHDGGHLTDVIQLAHLDFIQQKITFISIPRDLWVSLPSGPTEKINAAYALDSKDGTVIKQMTQKVTGLNPEYFIGVDFVGFQRLIGETLDGISVNVPETLEDPWYPIKGEEQNTCGKTPQEIAELSAQYNGFELEKQFECRYEHLSYPQGVQEMEGGDALKYVRSRHGSRAGDFSRSQRQQAVLKGVRDKLLSMNVLQDLPAFFELATRNTVTDIDLEVVKYITPALQHIGNYQIQTVVLSTDNVLTSSTASTGQFILRPKQDWAAVQAYIQEQL